MPRQQHRHDCDPVGLRDIAERLSISLGSLQVRNHNGALPPARWQISGRPAWCWQDVEQDEEKFRGPGRGRRST